MNKKLMFLGVGMSVLGLAVVSASIGTFAWFTVQNSAEVSYSSANISAPTSDLQVKYFSVYGNTVDNPPDDVHATKTDTIDNFEQSEENRVYRGFDISESRQLTDISGDGKNLFKPIFTSSIDVHNPLDRNTTTAAVYEVGWQGNHNALYNTTGAAKSYPYVRFGFEVMNRASAALRPILNITLSESCPNDFYTSQDGSESVRVYRYNARVAIHEVNQLDTNALYTDDAYDLAKDPRDGNYYDSTGSPVDGSGNAYTSSQTGGTDASAWRQVAICDSTGDTIYPLTTGEIIPSNPNGGVFLPDTSNPSTPHYTATAAKDGAAIDLASSLAANGSKFYACTLWIEGQDPDTRGPEAGNTAQIMHRIGLNMTLSQGTPS